MTEPEPPASELMTIPFPVAPNVVLHLEMPTAWQLLPEARTLRTVQQATGVLAGALGTLAAKDATYGGAWRDQGWRGNLARVLSKTTRLRRMLWRTEPIESSAEPVADTLQDLINLAVFMILNRQGGNEWGQENGGE